MPIPRFVPRWPLSALVSVLVLMTSACTNSPAGEADSAATAASGAAASPTGTPSAPPPAPALYTGDALLAHIVPLPAGAKAWTDQPATAMDLDAFINSFYDASDRTTARGLATQRGFVAAAFRGWREADGSANEVYLIEYSTDLGARSMKLGLTQVWKNDQQHEFVSEDSDQVSGQIARTLNNNGDARVWLITARRNTIVYVTHFSAATPDRQATLALLRQQADAIGS